MNRGIPFTAEENESHNSEHSRGTQGDLRNILDPPRLVACVLLIPEDAQPISAFLQKLGVDRSRAASK